MSSLLSAISPVIESSVYWIISHSCKEIKNIQIPDILSFMSPVYFMSVFRFLISSHMP